MSRVSPDAALPPLAPSPSEAKAPNASPEQVALSHLTRSLDSQAPAPRDVAAAPPSGWWSPTPPAPPVAPAPPPGLSDPSGSDALVFDHFIPSAQELVAGVDPHGVETTYVTWQSTHTGQVEVYTLEVPSNGLSGFGAALSKVADYASPPEVVNLSLGLNPAAAFLGDMVYLKREFEASHGSDHTLWSAATKADYKAQVQALVTSSDQAFKTMFAAVSNDIKAALEKLVSRGTTVVIASGNEGQAQTILDELGITPPDQFYDGCYLPDLPPGVVFVGASTGNEANSPPASFTTPVGAVDVAADGTSVPVSNQGDVADGTSFSAPQITGLVADMKALNPKLTPAQIEMILAESATTQPGQEIRLGAGVVNPQKALDLVRQRLAEEPILATVQANFQAFASAASGSPSDRLIDTLDLQAVAKSTTVSAVLRTSAQYLLDHPDAFKNWEGAQTGNFDGLLGSDDLAIWQADHSGIASPEFVAARILKANFSRVETSFNGNADGLLDKNDLAAVMNDTKAAPKLRDAAEYVYNNLSVFTALDNAQAATSDGLVSLMDISRWQEHQSV